MRIPKLTMTVTAAVALVVSGLAPAALGHAERDAMFPDGTGSVPRYRPMESMNERPHLVVCRKDSARRIAKLGNRRLRLINQRLLEDCEFGLVQAAVDAVSKRKTTIYVLPGVYREKPNRRNPSCSHHGGNGDGEQGAPILSYEDQVKCPHEQNLIGIFGDKDFDEERECNSPRCDLQIEGTGARPGDVLITGGFNKSGQFAKLNGIRADRTDGIYFRNFTIELFEFNALYILETDGFVIDDVVGRYNDEYAFLTFASDHGLYQNCEGYGNGDSGIYPGSASDVNSDSTETGELDRWSVEIRNCKSHHNALGYSGTAGNSVYVHDNEFYRNGTGIATDSLFPNHPGLPQDHGWFTDNAVHDNNVNYYERYVHSGVCDRKPSKRGYHKGVVCPVIPAPVGTGMLIAGGNYNYVEGNHFYDNWRQGVMLFGVPAALREEPEAGFDTSHFNHYVGNHFGFAPSGATLPNGLDVWWDDQGEGNCWQDNESSAGDVTHNATSPLGLPDCDSGGSPGLPAAPKQGTLAPCAAYDRSDPVNRDPAGCDWFDTPSKPEG